MIGKVCSAPPGGGSARGATKYVLGYALGDKADAKQARIDFDRIMHQSLDRKDFGVGELWKPNVGEHTRPSSIYCHGTSSLASFDQECQTLAQANPRCKEPVMHLVFSLGEGVERSDEEFVAGIRKTLTRLKMDDHAYLIAVHRDTLDSNAKPGERGNLHAHVVISAVNTKTMRAYNRFQFHREIDKAMRYTELELGWEHDRGLYKVDEISGEVVKTKKAELARWGNERRAERLERLEIKKEYLDSGFERKADATIGIRIAMQLDSIRESKEKPDWAEVHTISAKYGARVIEEPDEDKDSEPVLYLEDAKTGERVRFDSVVRTEIEDLGPYRSVQEAEEDLILRVKEDPDYIARRIVASDSTFDRQDIARFLDERLSDVDEVEELATLVELEAELELLQTETPEQRLYSTKAQYQLETTLRDHSHALANCWDYNFDKAVLDASVKKVEADLTAEARKKAPKAKEAKLSEEQRELVSRFGQGLCVGEGDPGTGKSVAMRVAKEYAARMNKEIVGLTISQAAARHLEKETGIQCYNTAKGLSLEELGEKLIPYNGLVVLDEAGMNDSKTSEHLLRFCRERNTQAIVIGDTKQLQSIGAGESLRILRQEADRADSYTTLIQIQRQRHEPHREAVKDLAKGLRGLQLTGKVDEEKITSGVKRLQYMEALRGVQNYETSIKVAAAQYVANQAAAKATGTKDETIYLGSSKETVRYANEEIRRRLGLDGQGQQYETVYGKREFSVGDEIVLRQNNKRQDLVNGDKATVIGGQARLGLLEIEHEDGRRMTLNLKRYDHIDHGYFQTYHSAQGASVENCVMLLDRSASAELFFVGVSRSKENIQIIYSNESFGSWEEVAEHLCDRSSLKTTSLTYEELTGPIDKDTIQKIYSNPNHPLRQRYEAVEYAKIMARQEALGQLHKTYQEKQTAVVGDLTLTPEQRREKLSVVRAEHKAESKAVIQLYAQVQFGRFVRDEIAAYAYDQHRVASREKQRDEKPHEQAQIAGREQEEKQRTKVREALRTGEHEKESGEIEL